MTTTRRRRTRSGTSHNGWRTLRVVVEVPSRGRYSEKDLAYHVEGALKASPLWRTPDQDFGRVRVLQHNRKRPYL